MQLDSTSRRSRKSNCLFFVWHRWRERGGFVIVRKSPHGWWPHFIWSQDLVIFEEYTPQNPRFDLLIPPPLYRGIVRRFRPKDEQREL